MKKLIYILFLILLVFCKNQGKAQEVKKVVYLISGQGADSRLFNNLEIDNRFEVKNIEYFTPEKGWSMNDFAKALALQIDTNRQYFLVGVSLGGMLATEMGDFLNPEKIILISSAKNRNELPGRYKFQKVIPLYKIFPAGSVKWGAKVMQPIVEPDRNYDKEIFKAMLDDKDPIFLKRTVAMIMKWNRKESENDIIHIHGNNDHTIPSKNIDFDFLIKNGSHMMVYTRSEEISAIVNKLLIGE